MINIVLTEDDPSVRRRIFHLLAKMNDVKLTADVKDGAELLALLGQGIKNDVLLIGLKKNELHDHALMLSLRQGYPNTRIVLYNGQIDEKAVIRAFKDGTNAYLPEAVSEDEFIFTIRHIYQFPYYLASSLSQRLLERVLRQPEQAAVQHLPECDLSKREVDILSLLAGGFTNQEVADKLLTSKRKIENERQVMLNKSGSRNMIALVRLAMLNGVI